MFTCLYVLMCTMSLGTLSVVATPIGNLQDITARALETLRRVEIILCEDTRQMRRLLDHFGISATTLSYHQHNSSIVREKIVAFVQEGKSIALITDAGTPGISDPGNELIEHIIKRVPDAVITPIPGPSAVTAALSVCGFPTSSFLFLGFPPHKNKRNKFFQEVAAATHTVVFYESSHRIKKCLQEIENVVEPDRLICVCRELTKKFETMYRGKIRELKEMNISDKGEFVVVISEKR